MSISLLDNLSIKKKSPNVERDLFDTVADMVAFSENYLPDVFECNVKEDGQRYRYNVSNLDMGDGLGKWRLVGGGDGSTDMSAYPKRTEVENMLDDKVDKEDGKTLTTNDFTDAYKDLVDANKSALDILNGDDTVDGSVSKKAATTLSEAKTYTDEQLALLEKDLAIACDEKPTYADGTVTYIKNGVTETTDEEAWFYYMADNKLMQTIWVDGVEFTIESAGGVNFAEYVSKLTDVVSTYSGDETETSKIPDIGAMKALEAKMQGNIDGKLDNTQDISKAGYVAVVGDDGHITFKEVSVMGGSAEMTAYDNAEHPDLTNVDKALDKILAKLYYVEPKINSFTMTPSTTEYEIGSVVSGLQFAWTVNKDIVSQSLTDCTIELDDRAATYGADLTNTKTFTLTISDGEKSATASKKISFLNKAYWGSAVEPASYDSAFILALSGKKFASSKNGTYSMTVGAGEYGYLALPTSFGTVSSCWIGGFEVSLASCGAIAFTNASNNTSSYTIYKTERSGLGSISMEVK